MLLSRLLVAGTESRQSSNTNTIDMQMQDTKHSCVGAVRSIGIPCVHLSSLNLNRCVEPLRNCYMSPYRADYIMILQSFSAGPLPFQAPIACALLYSLLHAYSAMLSIVVRVIMKQMIRNIPSDNRHMILLCLCKHY